MSIERAVQLILNNSNIIIGALNQRSCMWCEFIPFNMLFELKQYISFRKKALNSSIKGYWFTIYKKCFHVLLYGFV